MNSDITNQGTAPGDSTQKPPKPPLPFYINIWTTIILIAAALSNIYRTWAEKTYLVLIIIGAVASTITLKVKFKAQLSSFWKRAIKSRLSKQIILLVIALGVLAFLFREYIYYEPEITNTEVPEVVGRGDFDVVISSSGILSVADSTGLLLQQSEKEIDLIDTSHLDPAQMNSLIKHVKSAIHSANRLRSRINLEFDVRLIPSNPEKRLGEFEGEVFLKTLWLTIYAFDASDPHNSNLRELKTHRIRNFEDQYSAENRTLRVFYDKKEFTVNIETPYSIIWQKDTDSRLSDCIKAIATQYRYRLAISYEYEQEPSRKAFEGVYNELEFSQE